MQYLHGIGITHRDLKPENLLYASADPTSVTLSSSPSPLSLLSLPSLYSFSLFSFSLSLSISVSLLSLSVSLSHARARSLSLLYASADPTSVYTTILPIELKYVIAITKACHSELNASPVCTATSSSIPTLALLMLYSCFTHALLILYSCCTHALLMLYSSSFTQALHKHAYACLTHALNHAVLVSMLDSCPQSCFTHAILRLHCNTRSPTTTQ